MNVSGCYVCHTPIPTLDMANGYSFKCSRCGCYTKPNGRFEGAVADWNTGILYTDVQKVNAVCRSAVEQEADNEQRAD